MPGNTVSRPASIRGTGDQKITGRVTLNLMVPHPEAMAQAGEVDALPPGVIVILRVDGLPDPAVVDRLRRFGGHLNYEVHGRTVTSTTAWVRALREGFDWIAS